MYHVILIAIIATLFLAVWNLVHATPRAVQMLLPPQVAMWAGTAMVVISMFFSFAAAVLVQSGAGMVGFMLQGFIGFWVLALHLQENEDALRRAFLMLGVLLAGIVGAFYIQDVVGIGLITMVIVVGGLVIFKLEAPFIRDGSQS